MRTYHCRVNDNLKKLEYSKVHNAFKEISVIPKALEAKIRMYRNLPATRAKLEYEFKKHPHVQRLAAKIIGTPEVPIYILIVLHSL